MKKSAAALLLLLTLCLLLPSVRGTAASDGLEPTGAVSDSTPEIESGLVDFTRVSMVPANVEIPYFYQEVVNISGMYIFTTPDGVVHKRIYGALNDVYGWYVPVGAKNLIYGDAKPVDTADDVVFYENALLEAEMSSSTTKRDYTGLLPPEQGSTGVTELNGIPIIELCFYCAGGVAALCLLISICASGVRRRRRRKNMR